MQTEHLNAFWKDEFDGSLHNPMLSVSTHGTVQGASSSSTINNSHSNVSALVGGRSSRNNSVQSSNNNNEEAKQQGQDRKSSVDGGSKPARRASRSSNAQPPPAQQQRQAGATPSEPTIPEEPEAAGTSPPVPGASPPAERQLLGTREGEMNIILALPIVYLGEAGTNSTRPPNEY